MSWVMSTTPSEKPVLQYVNVIASRACKHDASSKYSGRVKLAGSLAELGQAVQSRTSIVLTRTFGNEAGGTEAANFAGQQRIMSVRRGYDQCIGCAVCLAHVINAIVVIA